MGMFYLLGMLWHNLYQNHRPGETQLLPTLGVGNTISMLRGLLMAMLFGFLFSPWPGGWQGWIPGLLYTLAAMPDYLDGYFARTTDHVTRLGEILDMNVDSLGFFTATLLAFRYGQVPWWFLVVGLARYIFLAGIWLRESLGKPVYQLPFSTRRRWLAGLTMGLFFVILYPLFTPPATHFVATLFVVPVMAGFIWDWFIVSGVIPQDVGSGFSTIKNVILRQLPVILRCLIVFLIAGPLVQGLIDPANQRFFVVTILDAVIVLLLFLGIAGRISAVAGLILMGVHQLYSSLTLAEFVLLTIYTSLLLLGTGAFSLWPIEDRLIYYRPGDDQS